MVIDARHLFKFKFSNDTYPTALASKKSERMTALVIWYKERRFVFLAGELI